MSSLGAAQAPLAEPPGQAGLASGSSETSGPDAGADSSHDIRLWELGKTLRSIAADSPETQSRLEQIAENYAQGTYRVDAQATAAKIIDHGFE